MADTMTFPKTLDEFMEECKIVDTEQVYTNGAELVPIFRIKQWEDAQTVDTVPVIRCKDCKHWLPHEQFGFDADNDEYHNYCGLLVPDDDYYAFTREAYEYCSRAEPVIRCKDCVWHCDNSCSIHPYEPMRDNDFCSRAERKPLPIKRGHWIEKSTGGEHFTCCSECGYVEWNETNNYCPNCGADMRGEK